MNQNLEAREQVTDPGKRALFRKIGTLVVPSLATAFLAERYFQGFAGADVGSPANGRVPFEHGKYQTYPRLDDEQEHHLIDVAPLGPDVDKIVALDFRGSIRTGALLIHRAEGTATESRVVMNIRPGTLKYVQFQSAIGGESWDLYKITEHGGNPLLDRICKFLAEKTARPWQDVYYLGDLGLFEIEWGHQEQELLNRMIRTQMPPRAGIMATPFANPGLF